MTNAYCYVDEVKARLSQDVPNMGSGRDQSIADKIIEVARDIDRKVALKRGDLETSFSFLADQPYGRQVVSLSATPRPNTGVFYLSFAGATTGPIAFDADGTAVQAMLENTTGFSVGDVSVAGNPGGPWTVDFAGELSGPQPVMTGYADVGVLGASVTVLPAIEGKAEVPSMRKFQARRDIYGQILPIHACVEVLDVATYAPDGSVIRTWLPGVDYMTWPLNGTPIQALKASSSFQSLTWPEWPNYVGVRSRWGMATYVLPDVRETAIIEVIRSLLGDVAGNDDRLGITPYGSIITAKAFTSKFHELVEEYGCTLW